MPLRFRKSFKILPGVKINLSKSGISSSIGKPGATVNIGKRGTRTTVGIPGTGLSYTSQSNASKTTPQSNTPRISQGPGTNDPNNNGGCLGLITFPFRILADLLKGIVNPETRKSTAILGGVVLAACLGCFGLSSIFGSTPSSPSLNINPTKTQVVEISIAQTSYAAEKLTRAAASPTPAITVTEASLFQAVTLADYPRVAASKLQELQASFAEIIPIHQQLATDPSVGKDTTWHSHATTILSKVVVQTNELASMNNYPIQYATFHQAIQDLAGSVKSLETNYATALNNQDVNAINQATTDLSNSIGYLNQAFNIIQTLQVTPTPIPSQTPLPTATVIIYVAPTQASGCIAAYPDFCITGNPRIACADLPKNFRVLSPDPLGYDRDNDGVGCEN